MPISQINTNSIANGAVVAADLAAGSVVLTGSAVSGVLPQASGGTGTTTGFYGFKNRIINGDMSISQRFGTSSTTINTAAYTYTLDRWSGFGKSAAGVFTIQQSTTAPAGFNNSALLTVTTSATPSGSDYYIFRQAIEGNNLQDVNWGTANAQAVTLSFWARSSVTGTFSGALFSNADSSVYPFTYVISSANTWTNISISVPGPTSGSFSTGTGNYLNVSPLILGAGQKTTPNAWGTSGILGSTGATDLISTNGATFFLTGVQLEKGSTATSFDYLPYTTELQLCQRYFSNGSYTNPGGFISGAGVSVYSFLTHKVTMRATPTVTASSCQSQASGGAVTNRTFNLSGNDAQGFATQLATSDPLCYVTYQANIEL